MFKKLRGAFPWLLALGALGFAFKGCLLPDPKPPAPDIGLPPLVKTLPGVAVEIAAESKADKLEWEHMGDGKAPQLLRTGNPLSTWFVTPRQGKYRIRAEAVIDGKISKAETLVTVGDPGPDPEPGPDPGPDPTPGPAPIPADGLHVLVVYESQDAKPLIAASQWYALNSQDVLSYLNLRAKGNWRIWDKDVPTKDESKLWQDAMTRAKGKMKETPWVIVSNPQMKGGYEGPLPKTKDEILKLFQRWGGI